MRIILDTNVFVSGIFWSGPPSRIVQAWADGKVSLVLSIEILDEYERIAQDLALKYPSIDFAQVLRLVEANSEIMDVSRIHPSVCADPNDDKFFSCALAAGVSIIVSGDKHLLDVSGYEGITVLKAKEFNEKYL